MRSQTITPRRRGSARGAFTALAALAAATAITAGAAARAAAAPQSSAPPTISGQAQEGKTLLAHPGTWTNSPTGFGYQWQQCDASGASCSAINGATASSYLVASGDADHTLRVVVTATNADGSTPTTSAATALVSSAGTPHNTASPTIAGMAKVGEALTASPGSWTGGVGSFTYQWERCDANGGSCQPVQDATAKSYGVRTADAGSTLRVVVTASNLAGSSTAASSPTASVPSAAAPPPAATTTAPAPAPPSASKPPLPPTIQFWSLRRTGHRLYARFSLCDQSPAALTVVERDLMPGRLGLTHRFSVVPRPCGTHARSWLLIPRLRHPGRFTATLRAVDRFGASSRTVSRSLDFPGAL